MHKCSCTFSIPVAATLVVGTIGLLKLETYSGAIFYFYFFFFDLLVCTLFGSEAATQITLPGLK